MKLYITIISLLSFMLIGTPSSLYSMKRNISPETDDYSPPKRLKVDDHSDNKPIENEDARAIPFTEQPNNACAMELNEHFSSKERALHNALERYHLPNIQAALAAGADSNASDPENYGRTALAAAVHFDSNNNIIQCLLKHKADINAFDDNGLTPILFAADNGQLNHVRLLFDHHADISILDPKNRETIIHKIAKQEGGARLLSYLLSAFDFDIHSDIHNFIRLRDFEGLTAAQAAFTKGQRPAFRLLTAFKYQHRLQKILYKIRYNHQVKKLATPMLTHTFSIPAVLSKIIANYII